MAHSRFVRDAGWAGKYGCNERGICESCLFLGVRGFLKGRKREADKKDSYSMSAAM